jgi:C4-type Zn-finger protein
MAARECPMCGETMQLHDRETVERVPGSPQTATTTFSEWICPECDYFEDADDPEN